MRDEDIRIPATDLLKKDYQTRLLGRNPPDRSREGEFPLGRLDVSFYRDDFSRSGLHPQLKSSDIPFEVEERPIVIVDDVLYTGRTIRAAMNEIFDYGRPARIDLAVLIDRGGRELPVCPRWIGQTLQIEPGKNLQLERGEGSKLILRLIDA